MEETLGGLSLSHRLRASLLAFAAAVPPPLPPPPPSSLLLLLVGLLPSHSEVATDMEPHAGETPPPPPERTAVLVLAGVTVRTRRTPAGVPVDATG